MTSKKKAIGFAVILTACGLAGCGAPADTKEQDLNNQVVEEEEFLPETVGTYEAEEAELIGNVHKESGTSGYSGEGYVTGFAEDADTCVFHVEISETGFYDLNFYSASSDYKENYVSVDGDAMGTVVTETKEFDVSALSRVYLEAGEHEISVAKYWGWIDLDKLDIVTAAPIDPAIYQVSAKLCNENATEEAKRLMSYLCDNYGSKIISGQYCDTGAFGKEFQVVKKATGKTPAVLGLDFIEYSPSRVENGSSSKATDFAIQHWENGGIVTFCWHWNVPSKYLTGEWYKGFYKEHTSIDLAKIMNGEDEEGYDLLMQDIDAIAEQLLILQDAGVPVLWRPLHEAAGGWFWWGDAGAEAYKKLYICMYEKLTNEYGLNNLIWLWNGQDADWYPGDEYVDIIGEDIYPGERVYTSQINKYMEAVNYTNPPKMVVLSENGCVFDPDLAVRDGDGVTDVYGYGSRWDFLVYNLTMSNGTGIAMSDKENLSSPEVAEVLDFIYNMYNVDHVARPWDSEDFDGNMNAYIDGKVAFWIDAAWISDSNKDSELGFDVVWCPWPIGPSGDEATNKFKNVSSGNAWMIPAGVDNPELVYNVFYDWQNWYHGDTDLRDGDLTWWEDCAITEENYAVMEYMGERGAFDLWNALGLEWEWSDLLNGNMTAAQFQETYKQSVQDALDGFYH